MGRQEAQDTPGPIATRWPIYVLVVAAILEVVVNRVLIGSVSQKGIAVNWIEANVEPPTWYTLLSYLGLLLFYFTSALAGILVIARGVTALMAGRGIRDAIAQVSLLAAAALAFPLLFVGIPELGLLLEIGFAVCVIATVASVFAPGRDLGAQIGIGVLAIPLLVHTVAAFGAHFVWVENITFDGPVADITRAGVFMLTIAALVSPYCFGPRPFSRAVTKPVPVVLAMVVAALGATLAHLSYPSVVKAASLAIGVELTAQNGDPRLAIYLLSIATLMWTLASCVLAGAPARRMIGAGIALVVLGGYAFKWPNHYLLPLLGLALIAESSRTVRDEELDALPIAAQTPPIADATWSSFVGLVVAGLRRTFGEVHSLTTRGENDLVSTLFVGDKDGLQVRARVERYNGSVLALDIVVGKEIDEVRGATLVLWAIPTAATGANPAGPPAAPVFRTTDGELDAKFRTRGSLLAFNALFDDALRARVVAQLDGWLAYWDKEGLRYRAYPGHGSPLDHPIPLSDLALNRPASAERLVAVFELLAELGARCVAPAPIEAPKELTE